MIEATDDGHYRNMNALLRPSLMLALSMLAAGCSPPSAFAELEGPGFVLTAQEPVAAFEVTLCLNAPTDEQLFVQASVAVEARTTLGTAALRLESLADRPADERSLTAEVSSALSPVRWFGLQADGDWKARGRRCATPEVVEFSAERLSPGASLKVESWSVQMDVTWEGRAFSDSLDSGDLTVEIEQL